MANTPIADLKAAKLITKYPTAKKTLTDLLFAYWSDPATGNNAGVPKGGDALWSHYGGSKLTLTDREQDYWNAFS